MSIILANFGKYAISDCPFIMLSIYMPLAMPEIVEMTISCAVGDDNRF